jgi:hypothetical protein
MVHGAKTRPRIPTSQGKLKLAREAFTRTGARSHQTRKPSLGPANIRTAKKQHMVQFSSFCNVIKGTLLTLP